MVRGPRGRKESTYQSQLFGSHAFWKKTISKPLLMTKQSCDMNRKVNFRARNCKLREIPEHFGDG